MYPGKQMNISEFNRKLEIEKDHDGNLIGRAFIGNPSGDSIECDENWNPIQDCYDQFGHGPPLGDNLIEEAKAAPDVRETDLRQYGKWRLFMKGIEISSSSEDVSTTDEIVIGDGVILYD